MTQINYSNIFDNIYYITAEQVIKRIKQEYSNIFLDIGSYTKNHKPAVIWYKRIPDKRKKSGYRIETIWFRPSKDKVKLFNEVTKAITN